MIFRQVTPNQSNMAVYKFCPTDSFCEYYGVTSAIKWAIKAPKIEIVLAELN